ncbi:MAG: phosphoglucosamine mutase [Bacteroidales bacterium]|nr:phosphoglucosamine mutase [Bacteroidales bacterium]MBN2817484.1 phosphoglucosamine mutase [Bacteroidales bacterium]
MTLIKSISGFRGTIGGKPGNNLTPLDIVKFTAAFAHQIRKKATDEKVKVVVGRDARVSGPMLSQLVTGTLQSMGVDVVDLGLATTPTTEMAVIDHKAQGGIILTASHNPAQWNALKLLNEKGEFISASDGKELLDLVDKDEFNFNTYDKLGKVSTNHNSGDTHIRQVLDLPLVDVEAISKAKFKVAIDCVNSVGGVVLPKLLMELGVDEVIELYCTPNGLFPHNPEPLPENLTEISKVIKEQGADLGFVVDPDVDRLAIVSEDGTMFGEEYTLVAVADYILSNTKGNTVSNLSSSLALRDITLKHGGKYATAAVGEVNVVEKMKETNAIIGGEGNGGVIYPELHNGRDALVGIALFLTHLAKSGMKCSELRKTYPEYVISKNKLELSESTNVDAILESVKQKYSDKKLILIDGVKIEFENEWVHLRKSNTEPIIRIYSESSNKEKADRLAGEIIQVIKSLS